MEPTETICELAERFAIEDRHEARARRFAKKLDATSRKTGIPRHKLLIAAGGSSPFAVAAA